MKPGSRRTPARDPAAAAGPVLPVEHIASSLLGQPYATLDPAAQRVALHVARRKRLGPRPAAEPPPPADRGARAADALTAFGGSWRFVGLFTATVLAWLLLNVLLLARLGSAFDPYPFILLNLVLSTMAAIQAPILLMSQNRQAEKDRVKLDGDYEVNLKAELEILLLHQKLDRLQHEQWHELLALQREQLDLLRHLRLPRVAEA
ncbi:DUF1003 domain-containing protein [Piscinibacter sp. Jin2]|uniref:DUF1003 domain-containing protein n=1 Tax=Aquariibacter lacus TaxID=2801332 RepID=A0A9X0XHB2_9BURK|nr:DUF1003 domain-containing protein [Piscinibacter lacus]MBL0720896.1 DUF1003 domain-containing protein [Piscinibacter lacus]